MKGNSIIVAVRYLWYTNYTVYVIMRAQMFELFTILLLVCNNQKQQSTRLLNRPSRFTIRDNNPFFFFLLRSFVLWLIRTNFNSPSNQPVCITFAPRELRILFINNVKRAGDAARRYDCQIQNCARFQGSQFYNYTCMCRVIT